MTPNRWLKEEAGGDYVLLFGKYEGKTLDEVHAEDPEYLEYCYLNFPMLPEIEEIFQSYI